MQKRKKLSTTLVITTAIILVVLNVITAICVGSYAFNSMSRKENEYLEATLSDANTFVTHFMDKYKKVAEMIAMNPTFQDMAAAASPEQPLDQGPWFADTVSLMGSVTEKYPAILGMSWGSIAENVPYTATGQRVDAVMSERPYYEAAKTGGTIVTEPYMDAVTNKYCTSIGAPIYKDDNLVGVFCVDIDLSEFSAQLTDMAFGETGRMMLFSSNNEVMGCDNVDFIGMTPEEVGFTGDIMEELDAVTGKLTSYNVTGAEKTGIVQHVGVNNWKILAGLEKSEYHRSPVLLLGILVGILVVSVLLTAVLIRSVLVKKLRPVSSIREALGEMQEGRLNNIQLPEDTGDEIGEISEAVRDCAEKLSTYIREIARTMSDLADGDLTTESDVEFVGDFAEIKQSIEEFIETLVGLIRDITTSSEAVRSGSEQVSSGAQALAQGATEQASSVQELAATIADISEHIKSNTALANEASDNAVEVNTTITESGEKMHETMGFMGEISECSKEVSKIIKTIEDIAFQTNILSLNAAVEAARAGSAGKGFAVVADEVRNLADKSAEASKSTTQLIERTLQAVEKGSESMGETAEYMDNVVKQAEGLTEAFQKISAASNEQAEQIAQVTVGTDQISSVVQTNSATAEESAAASEELSSQAQVLSNLISQFRIE